MAGGRSLRRGGTAVLLGALVATASLAMARCGARTPLLVPDPDATDGARDAGLRDAPIVDLCADAAADASADGACAGLRCDVPDCGAGRTSLRGVVRDPSGQRPLYDVFVYVPNGPLEPMPAGPVCATCQAAASGDPIVTAVTDAEGRFTLLNPPAGARVPLVMQLGKWRRKVEVEVRACAANVIDAPDLLRMPRSSSEGDIPAIALATGCDDIQCFLTGTLGLSPSELTGPDGPGRVHVYRSPHAEDPNIPGAGALGDPYVLWGDLAAMRRYDILVHACECTPHPRQIEPDRPALELMKQYLEGGGRLLATHYHFNWFTKPDAPLDFQEQAPWVGENLMLGPPPFAIDTTHPRGQAFADWLVAVGASTTRGSIDLVDTRASVAGLAGGQPGHGPYTNTTQWIYHPSDLTNYLSFDTPTDAISGRQCGRAVFSDVHLSGEHGHAQPFPAYCVGDKYRTNEIALEFLFFDLASCVQDDALAPTQPCRK